MANTCSRLITVNKSGAGALTNYSHLVCADTTAWAALDETGDDVRFKDAGGSPIDHYVIPINDARSTIKNANTSFLVRIPTVAASGDTLITMEYGDAALPNTENGSSAFNVGGAGVPGFFDDFVAAGANPKALNAVRWPTQAGTWTEEDGPPKAAKVATTTSATAMGNVGINRANGVRLLTRMKYSNYAVTLAEISCVFYIDANHEIAVRQIYTVSQRARIQTWHSPTAVTTDVTPYDLNGVYATSMTLITPTNIDYYYDYIVNPALKASVAENAITGAGYPRLYVARGNSGTNTAYYDFVGMCSYDSTVTTTSVGAEADLGPIINTVVPDRGYQGTTVPVTITGANFAATPAVTFTRGAETIVATGEHYTSSAQIECNVPIGVAETLGWWSCTVTNP